MIVSLLAFNAPKSFLKKGFDNSKSFKRKRGDRFAPCLQRAKILFEKRL